jgi:hypothetical protein
MERLGEHLEPDMVDAELVARLREAVERIERRAGPSGGGGSGGGAASGGGRED